MLLNVVGTITDKTGIHFDFNEKHVTKIEVQDGGRKYFYEINGKNEKIVERLKKFKILLDDEDDGLSRSAWSEYEISDKIDEILGEENA